MNKPLGDPMVIDEQDAGVREVRDTGKVKVAPGAPRQNENYCLYGKNRPKIRRRAKISS